MSIDSRRVNSTARKQQDQANQTFNEAQNAFQSSQKNAASLYGQLFPLLAGEAMNPQGLSPKDLAAENTASQQSVGGSTAGAIGQGNLTAARTRNAGGFGKALDAATQSGQRQLSENALGIQSSNAALKEAQKQEGLSGLSNLYGSNSQQMLSALGLGNQATQVGTEAGKSGWFQNFLGTINALTGAAKGAPA